MQKIYLEVRIDCPTPQKAQLICNEIEKLVDSWVDDKPEEDVEYATCSVIKEEF